MSSPRGGSPHPDAGRQQPVLVAVASLDASAALGEAVDEAVRAGCPVQVMHALDLAVREDGVLERAVQQARELARGRVHVSSALHHGSAVDGVIAMSAGARLLVIQRRPRVPERRGVRGRLITGSLAPVLCVPERRQQPLPVASVTVGVHDPVTCGPLIDAAAQVAASRDARLTVVHVRQQDDDGLADRELATVLAASERRDPAVDVVVSVVTARPAAHLISLSAATDLIVLGRHHPQASGDVKVGTVARRVVSEARCPVLLSTPDRSGSPTSWVASGRPEENRC